MDGQVVSFKDFFTTTNLLGHYLIASAIVSLVVALGLVLLIVPGIVLAVMFMFYAYFIIDKKMKAFDALKQSMALTKGYRMQLFGILALLILMNIAGAIALLVGLLVTIPITSLAVAHMYRQLV